jgi:hypothetical protein
MRAGKPKLPWKRIVAITGFALILAKVFFSWISPNLEISQKITTFTIAILFVEFLYCTPLIIKRYHQSRQQGITLLEQIISLIPEKLIGLFQLERAQQRSFFSWVRKKPFVMNKIDGEIFSYYQKSQHSTLLIILYILLLTDIPISTLMLSLALDDVTIKLHLHTFLGISTLYSFAWLISEKYAVKSTYHIAGGSSLYLQVGERFNAEIAWIACKDVQVVLQNKEIKESTNTWLHKQGFAPEKTVFCTPFDQPNVALTLNENMPVKIEKFKIKRSNIKYILIFVDDPCKFAHSIHKHIESIKTGNFSY